MPIISDLEVTGATYDTNTRQITVAGVAFSDNQYSGKIEVSVLGVVWTEVDTYDSWSDTEVVGTFAADLDPGSYKVRVTNGDNEVSPALEDAFSVSSASGFRSRPNLVLGPCLCV